jgi:hypothetical protein
VVDSVNVDGVTIDAVHDGFVVRATVGCDYRLQLGGEPLAKTAPPPASC